MKYYVVFRGHVPGVYDNWEETKEQTNGFPGALYKSYHSSEEAAEAFRNYSGEDDLKDLEMILNIVHEVNTTSQASDTISSTRQPTPIAFPPSNPEIDPDAWTVDAACAGNPGLMEYRCVNLADGKVVFHKGPYEDATNNIGEFLALVHAMSLMTQNGDFHNIYSDSQTAMAWVRNKKANTKLRPTEKNGKVFELLARACVWLNTHHFPMKIMKWQTDRWGEIPADFGRK